MRNVFLLCGLMLLGTLCATGSLQAQVSMGLSFNIGSQPVWGPTGYDHVDYYYLPDAEAYYNVSERRFYYFEGGRWVGRSRLPERYRNINLYTTHKVVVNERQPYRNHEKYRAQYSSFRGQHDQSPIRDSHDSKYYVNRNHPEHNNWVREQNKPKGRGNWKNQGDDHKGKKH